MRRPHRRVRGSPYAGRMSPFVGARCNVPARSATRLARARRPRSVAQPIPGSPSPGGLAVRLSGMSPATHSRGNRNPSALAHLPPGIRLVDQPKLPPAQPGLAVLLKAASRPPGCHPRRALRGRWSVTSEASPNTFLRDERTKSRRRPSGRICCSWHRHAQPSASRARDSALKVPRTFHSRPAADRSDRGSVARLLRLRFRDLLRCGQHPHGPVDANLRIHVQVLGILEKGVQAEL